MKIQMKLESDAIFGNGMSIPGEEDISVLCDEYGFPYYKGGTFKGIFREELENLLSWQGYSPQEAASLIRKYLGGAGDDADDAAKLTFSDFTLPGNVRQAVLAEPGMTQNMVRELFTNVRTFTALDDNGMVQDGSLRMARCVNQGLLFCSEIRCSQEDEELVRQVLGLVKWIGSMRNRGFGKVCIFTAE